MPKIQLLNIQRQDIVKGKVVWTMTSKANEDLSRICQIIHQTVDVEKIYLFGSYAYGTPNQESDYDLCVLIPDHSLRPADAVKRIRRALFPVQGTPLDVIVYRTEVFKQRQAQPSLERKIAREGIILYEQQGEMEQRMV
nr:nucleotidyltransferase domain-containing protein [uncultured Oscillibacter sp.]